MSRDKSLMIIEEIDRQYPKFFGKKKLEDISKEWHKTLKAYDYNEVKEELQKCMAMEQFTMRPPTLYRLVSNLKPLEDQVNWNELVYYCDLCHKAFNDLETMQKHRARENSIEYIVNQTAKWFNRTLTHQEIKALWNMDDERFDTNYKKLLLHIYRNTKVISEKTIIGFIFNPPNEEQAKEFLNSNNEKLQENIIYS